MSEAERDAASAAWTASVAQGREAAQAARRTLDDILDRLRVLEYEMGRD